MSAVLFIGALTLVILATLYAIAVHNRLVSLQNRYLNSFAQIDVQLQRRYDLIPNMVETARAYMAHERQTLEAVITARNQALAVLRSAAAAPNAEALGRLGGAENALRNALGRLNVIMEAYPDLKANSNMLQFSEELASTENRVAFARQAFNDMVMAYNIYRQSFPQILLAKWVGHGTDATLLEFEDGEKIRRSPAVSF
jgi:LemA protein